LIYSASVYESRCSFCVTLCCYGHLSYTEWSFAVFSGALILYRFLNVVFSLSVLVQWVHFCKKRCQISAYWKKSALDRPRCMQAWNAVMVLCHNLPLFCCKTLVLFLPLIMVELNFCTDAKSLYTCTPTSTSATSWIMHDNPQSTHELLQH